MYLLISGTCFEPPGLRAALTKLTALPQEAREGLRLTRRIQMNE